MDENGNLDELSRQLEMLEDLPTEDILADALGVQNTPVQQVQPQVGVPQTPENPLNQGVVTNNIIPNTVQQVPMQPQPQGVTTTTTGTVPVQQVVQEQANQQAQAQVVQPSTTQIPTVGLSQPVQQMTSQVSDLSIFDNDDDEPVFVNIGEVVQESKVPFVDLKPGETTRIMIFTKQMLTVHTHFIKDIGSIRCLSKRDERGYVVDKAPCCMFKDDEGKEMYAKIRRILPVIEYPVSKDGKSFIANAKPQLKFMVISLNDMKSLDAILSNEENAKAAMGFDFLVTIDKDDRWKTKVFSSTFNTIRGQFAEDIKAEISKCTKELMLEARDEKFRKVPAEKIQQALIKSQTTDAMAANMMNQQTPTLDSLLQ